MPAGKTPKSSDPDVKVDTSAFGGTDDMNFPGDIRSAQRLARLVAQWWAELSPEAQVKVIHQAYRRYQGEAEMPTSRPTPEDFSSYFRRNV